MPGPLFPYTDLDADQCIKQSFDEVNDRLRVDAVVTASIGEVKITDGVNDATLTQVGSKFGLDVNILNDLYVNIAHTDDSVRLGDGTNFITSTQVLAKNGLDVNVINPITITDNTIRSIVNVYNEISSVASGVETTILTYTVPIGKTAYLLLAECAGSNTAYYKVLHNITTLGKQYTYFGGNLNAKFEFSTTIKADPGFKLLAGETITVRVRHERPSTGDFNSRVQVVEIT